MDLLSLNQPPTPLQNSMRSTFPDGVIALRELASEQTLFWQGDSASALFIVETGRLKIARHTAEGRSITLQIARSGDSLAESALFSDFYSYGAVAEIASRVIVYPKQPLLQALQEHPSLAEDLMTRLAGKNSSLVMQLELRDIRAAHRRVLQYLSYLAHAGDINRKDVNVENARVISFDRPLKEIAIDLGLTPATLSRALTRLEREGQITRKQNLIQLQRSSAA
jgi:CRP/FNR family transcriptional regulator, dissimilatory nitrate respiration regulator